MLVAEGQQRSGSGRGLVLCLVPAARAPRLSDPLERHFADHPQVVVLVDRRTGERRRKTRRHEACEPVEERRRVRGFDGRRVADRRVGPEPVPAPPLPRALHRHAAEVRFIAPRARAPRERADIDDARLALRFQAGHKQAFEQLYERWFDRLYGYMRLTIGDCEDARDATQQTLTAAYRALPRFELRADVPLRAWLYRIGRNEAIRVLNRRARVQPADPDELDRAREGPVADSDEADDWIADADLLRFIERLPLAQRQALTLRYLVGLSTEEISRVIDRTPQAVRHLEHRALRFLEKRMLAVGRGPTGCERLASLLRMRPLPVIWARADALQYGR
jgi:RNA polymerase sigma-70 factor (ECF subfamily)